MYEEENRADEKSEGLMSSGFAEEMREQVTDGGDVTLYRHKLENGGYQNRGKSKFEFDLFSFISLASQGKILHVCQQ